MLEEMTGAPLTAIETDLSKRSPGIGSRPGSRIQRWWNSEPPWRRRGRDLTHWIAVGTRDSWRRRPVMRGAPARIRMGPPAARWPDRSEYSELGGRHDCDFPGP